MRGDTKNLVADRDRIASELIELEKRLVSLENERAEITRKAETATGDTEALAQLKIESEQLAEAMRRNDRLIDQATKRLTDVEGAIAMLEQSDMV